MNYSLREGGVLAVRAERGFDVNESDFLSGVLEKDRRGGSVSMGQMRQVGKVRRQLKGEDGQGR